MAVLSFSISVDIPQLIILTLDAQFCLDPGSPPPSAPCSPSLLLQPEVETADKLPYGSSTENWACSEGQAGFGCTDSSPPLICCCPPFPHSNKRH